MPSACGQPSRLPCPNEPKPAMNATTQAPTQGLDIAGLETVYDRLAEAIDTALQDL